MLTRRALMIGTAASLAALAGVWFTVLRSTPAQAQFGGRVVYLGLSKDMAGNARTILRAKYKCNTNPVPCAGPRGIKEMVIDTTEAILPFKSHAPCDEVTTDGVLKLKWIVTARTDSGVFGTHAGTFEYKDDCGNIARGVMYGTVGCGTHRLPMLDDCEKCRAHRHFEGWLRGTFVEGPFHRKFGGRAALWATYAGEVEPNWPTAPPTPMGQAIKMNVDGVYIFPCLPSLGHAKPGEKCGCTA